MSNIEPRFTLSLAGIGFKGVSGVLSLGALFGVLLGCGPGESEGALTKRGVLVWEERVELGRPFPLLSIGDLQGRYSDGFEVLEIDSEGNFLLHWPTCLGALSPDKGLVAPFDGSFQLDESAVVVSFDVEFIRRVIDLGEVYTLCLGVDGGSPALPGTPSVAAFVGVIGGESAIILASGDVHKRIN